MANLDNSPANGAGGSSYLYDYGTSPNTRVAISSKVRLLTPHYGSNQAMAQLGVLATWSVNQSRNAEAVRGIGFGDKIAEIVPGVMDPATGSFERALVYLSNLWQATGYAAGADGPVRSLAHHRWPFDVEQQLVYSALADSDLGVANVGYQGSTGSFDGGIKQVTFPQVTPDFGLTGNPVTGTRSGGAGTAPGGARGHSAIITIYEGCWFTSTNSSISKDTGIIMESGDCMISDIHDFATMYGEFLATGNDPTIGQLGSMRFGGNNSNFRIAQAGGDLTGGSAQSGFVNI